MKTIEKGGKWAALSALLLTGFQSASAAEGKISHAFMNDLTGTGSVGFYIIGGILIGGVVLHIVVNHIIKPKDGDSRKTGITPHHHHHHRHHQHPHRVIKKTS